MQVRLRFDRRAWGGMVVGVWFFGVGFLGWLVGFFQEPHCECIIWAIYHQ